MSIREDEVPDLRGRELYDYQFAQLPPFAPPARGGRPRREGPPVATIYVAPPKRKAVSLKRPVYTVDSSDKLYDLVVTGKGGIKYNPRLVTKASAIKYLSDRNLEDKYNVLSGDFDDDVNTPDNVVIVDEQGRRRYIDGYSFTTRRPDVLYVDEVADLNNQVQMGTLDKNVADIKKGDIKKYNKTHVTAQSRADEPIDDFLNRVGNEKKFNVLHKLYLDRYPKEQRNDELEKTYKTKVLNSFPDIAIGPVMIVRRTLSQQVKGLEELGYRFRDKFGLINSLYSEIVQFYKRDNNLAEDSKLIGNDYLRIVLLLRERGIGNLLKNIISAFIITAPS
jgi:DNA-binding HxlR family transcriptional regulator